MKFLAVIQGGEGPDVWAKEFEIETTDFLFAADTASQFAEDRGGQVTSLEQWDDPLPRTSQAAQDVLAERRRQIGVEGYDTTEDDQYSTPMLARAAASYALTAGQAPSSAQVLWPFSHDCFKPTTPRRDLIKAGALILAEIERLDRAAAKQGGE